MLNLMWILKNILIYIGSTFKALNPRQSRLMTFHVPKCPKNGLI